MKNIFFSIGTLSFLVVVFLYFNSHYQPVEEAHFSKFEKVPDIVLTSPKGKKIQLSKLKGKLVLIDFWASWCGPCRKENPNIVEAYHKYKKRKFTNGNGFEVFSVSLDKNRSHWEEAIRKDKLSWKYHGIDFSKQVRQEYKVNSIPYGVLINGDGEVIAEGKELRGIKLHLVLDKYTKP